MELSLDDPQTGGPPPGGGGEEPKKPQKKKCPKCLQYSEECPGFNECSRVWAFLLRQAGSRKGLKDSSGGC